MGVLHLTFKESSTSGDVLDLGVKIFLDWTFVLLDDVKMDIIKTDAKPNTFLYNRMC